VSEPDDTGGDPACWAHLLAEDEGFVVADLAGILSASGDGVHWTLAASSDLNVNLVRLEGGHEIAEHTTTDVDVLLVVLAGRGLVHVGPTTVALAPDRVAHIPKGATRSIRAGAAGLTYLTVHRRRGGLAVGRA
jgi:mannose-6-phosphate isomerase-like protein (cupin superfamily)